MKVLVTGAGGCLGGLLSAHLETVHGHEVWRTSRRLPSGARHRIADLSQRTQVFELIEAVRPERIFHTAGSFSGDFAQDFAVNVESARFLAEAVAQARLATRVLVVGSAAEYGVVAADENPVAETRLLRPVSVYGLTKAMQTLAAGQAAAALGVTIVVARLFNLLAPDLSERLFVGRVQQQIQRYRTGKIRQIEVGNLDAQRDYVSAADAIAQLERIIEHGNSGEVYHVASGTPLRMGVLLARMLAEAGVPDTAIAADAAANRTGYDVPVIYADTRKTEKLGAAPCEGR